MSNARISEQQAVTVAADAVRMSGLPAAAHFVHRLDGQHPYYLVHFGQPVGPGAAVMVDVVDGSVMAHAAVEQVEQPWLLTKERALEIAACPPSAKARLVWKPCRATRSPFYPLWEISTASGTVASVTVWIDQSGRIWRDLALPGQG